MKSQALGSGYGGGGIFHCGGNAFALTGRTIEMNAQSRLEGFSDADFDPFTLDVKIYGDTLNPYEKIAELRKSGNVHAGEYRTLFMPERNKALQEFNFKYFTVLGYDLVKHILANPDLFSNKIHRHTIGRSFGRSLTPMDAPEHPIYRRLFQ